MTIDEYLNQAKKLKHKADRAELKLKEVESRTIDPRSSLNLGDGIPASNRSGNGTESRLLEYIDAGKAYTAASRKYTEFRKNLQSTVFDMPHWAALIIEQIYIYNVFSGCEEDLSGVGDILSTNDRRQILAKLSEAKELLADRLRVQGVEIEDKANEKTDY